MHMETFRYVGVKRQFWNSKNNMNSIEYTIKVNSTKSTIKQSQIDKVKRVEGYLCQAKFCKDVLPDKIPLRKTDISPIDELKKLGMQKDRQY